jgi:transposase
MSETHVFVASTASIAVPKVKAKSKLTPDEIRLQRGRIIAALCHVRKDGKDNRYLVPSQTGASQYLASIDPKKGPDWRCDCKDYEARQKPCKHIHAVQIVIEREKEAGKSTPPVAVRTKDMDDCEKFAISEQARPKRPTYKQDWPAYNAAQIHEKDRFQELLADLCNGVPEPARPHGGAKGGRIPVSMGDRAFAMALKVYTLMSGRRASTDMRDATGKGHLSTAPHYSRVARFMEDSDMSPILGDLIRESALPLRAVEQDFAVDSTGFGTSRFVRWFDQKYGIVRQRSEFVKVSVMTGIKTNICSAVRVGGQYSPDSPEFIPLLSETKKGFDVREVSADKAYSGYDNFDAVAAIGAVAYMTFKDNATGRLGGTYGKMLKEFLVNQDAYLAHYHKRSNVESTFSAMKAKFGDSLRSKTDVAMVNEALCKVLCHNVVVLIGAACELGIEAKFWEPSEPEPMATISHSESCEDAELWAWI